MSRVPESPYTADIRIGVTDAEHELLSVLDQHRPALLAYGKRHLMKTGLANAQFVIAGDCELPQEQRRIMLIAAAARLVLAVELMDAGQ